MFLTDSGVATVLKKNFPRAVFLQENNKNGGKSYSEFDKKNATNQRFIHTLANSERIL